MVQARALLAAIALTVTVPSVVQAMPWPCFMVRSYVKQYTAEQLEQMARDRGIVVTDKDRRDVRTCLRKR